MTTPAARALVFAGCAWLLASASPVFTGQGAGAAASATECRRARHAPPSTATASAATTIVSAPADLTLASLDPLRVGGHADMWERVVRKLRTREMPPPGVPRPDEATYVSAAAALEARARRRRRGATRSRAAWPCTA